MLSPFDILFQVDNEFFVPHGYLSDEEEGKDEDEVFNPEKEKVRPDNSRAGKGNVYGLKK